MKDIFTSVWLLKLVLLLFGFIPFLASTLDLINLPKPTSSISSFSDKASLYNASFALMVTLNAINIRDTEVKAILKIRFFEVILIQTDGLYNKL
jgi:hypothetical protein